MLVLSSVSRVRAYCNWFLVFLLYKNKNMKFQIATINVVKFWLRRVAQENWVHCSAVTVRVFWLSIFDCLDDENFIVLSKYSVQYACMYAHTHTNLRFPNLSLLCPYPEDNAVTRHGYESVRYSGRYLCFSRHCSPELSRKQFPLLMAWIVKLRFKSGSVQLMNLWWFGIMRGSVLPHM
jgi:hypothetical protein